MALNMFQVDYNLTPGEAQLIFSCDFIVNFEHVHRNIESNR